MTIHTTPVYGVAYCDPDTALVDLAAASQQAATTVEAALIRGGVAPPNAADLATVAGRVTSLETQGWTAYTPTWAAAPGGAAPVLGNGTLVGSYWKRGTLVEVSLLLTGGSTTTWGTAGWRLGLPFPVGSREVSFGARVNILTWGDMAGFAIAQPGASTLIPYGPLSNTDARHFPLQQADPGNAQNTGIPRPTGFAYGNGSKVAIFGRYESAA